ncbi:MAG TPA: hypothetical protein PLQ15_12410 [Syntrophales bacterium]|nr:hypothetical protein [Syntrophales bacterium]
MAESKRAMKAALKPFVGKWRIVEMEEWDREYIDMEGPGHFTFRKDGTGHFHFGLVRGEMDCRAENASGRWRIEFSWDGNAELDPVLGRGWAWIEQEELKGRIFFHLGDDSAFRAIKS